ncbi:protein crossbronx homolog isoform X1 [Chrysoperla carnea]|nr:protein crossbronx homolog isoform X1 [Chrysoperla carnea]XP_044743110.1 protein crossbronx homolog isoform X1 [Chrysoperla carnea]XP_044743111.1 protein crossbronx homolog isoform X1 [Chrysoperla carnea]XP_044743112.1 protein crossbronx homolog isoform X1 [Chrysoperla carnea]
MLVHDIETDKLCKIFQQEYIILAEYKMLQTENIQGIYVIPSYKSSFLWFGVIFVRSGIYEDGIFRFTITLPDTFPDSGFPRVDFQSKVFHPLINNETGELNICGGFPEWRKGEEHIWQLLQYIVYIFLNLDHSVKHCINIEAKDMYLNNRDEFVQRVKDNIDASVKQVYDVPPLPDKHYIQFSQYDHVKHDPVRLAILEPTPAENNRSTGYSWVEPGTFKPLSKTCNQSSQDQDS